MNAAGAPSRKRLAVLTLAVLVAHAWLLERHALVMPHRASEPAATFRFRTVSVAPEPVATPQPTPPPERAATPPAPRPRATPRRPPPAEASTAGPMASTGEAHLAGAPQPPEPERAAVAPSVAPVASSARTEADTTRPAPITERTQRLALPPPGRMHYEVMAVYKGVPVPGNAILQWRHDGQQYEATLDVTGPLFTTRRSQRSTGRITEEGLSPRYFSDKARSEQAVHFQPDEGRVIFSNNQPQAAFVAGMQDRLSVVLQLAALVAGEPSRYAAGARIVVRTASTRDAEDWTFDVEGEEEITLPAATLRALKLQRRPRKEYDQKVELWLAPGQDYAPVRVRLTNPNGDTVDQRWSSTDR